MCFNVSKYSVLHLGKGNPKNSYVIGNTPLSTSEKGRDLGVTITSGETLSWETQIKSIVGKATQITAWIVRNVISREAEVLSPLYKLFVRPHLGYNVQVWSSVARHGTGA